MTLFYSILLTEGRIYPVRISQRSELRQRQLRPRCWMERCCRHSRHHPRKHPLIINVHYHHLTALCVHMKKETMERFLYSPGLLCALRASRLRTCTHVDMSPHMDTLMGSVSCPVIFGTIEPQTFRSADVHAQYFGSFCTSLFFLCPVNVHSVSVSAVGTCCLPRQVDLFREVLLIPQFLMLRK